jgi:ABC-type oligopeptide transport system substrate-binding subunit
VGLTWDTQSRREGASNLSYQWERNLGITINWNFSEQYEERLLESVPPLRYTGWIALIPDPDYFLRVGWKQYSTWKNRDFDELMADARKLQSQTQRIENYRRADSLVMEELPIIPLLYPRLNLFIKPWIKYIPISPMGYSHTNWKDFVIEPH